MPDKGPVSEGLHIMRYDQQPEKRTAEILPDWRAWAQRTGYRQRLTVPVSSGTQSIKLEVWQNPAGPDKYLLYHPLIAGTSNTECLYILADKDTLESMLDTTRQMAQMVLGMVQTKDAVIREQKAQQN